MTDGHIIAIGKAAGAALPFAVRDMSAASGWLKVMVYGGPGTGKTYFLGSADDVEEMKPIGYTAFDKGQRSISDRTFKYLDMQTLDHAMALVRAIQNGQVPYKTILIDGVDALYTQLLRDLQAAGGKRFDADTPTQADYLIASSKFRAFLERMRDLPVNFICACQFQEIKETTGLTYIRPNLPGKLANDVSQYFDAVGYFYTKQDANAVKYYGQWQPYARVHGKARVPKTKPQMPTVTQDPTLRKVYDVMVKALTPPATPAELLDKLDSTDAKLVAQAAIVVGGGAPLSEPSS